MSTELWRRANALFEQLVDLPSTEQQAWLDRECADHPLLCAEVERRLLADAEAESASFLGQPLLSDRETSSQPPPGPDRLENKPPRLGPYRLGREIGRGGMGTVYAAERDDDAFRLEVAIKIISAESKSEEIVRRLREERRILALLDHPNIARIYDGGTTDDGRPYFVMERVQGKSLDDYCAKERLSIRQRTALLQQVCQAVDYAHRNLVVHRDIKPSNILVTQEGVPKLLDFGIAKVLDGHSRADSAAEATVPWRQHLTLNYASPEQLRGQAVSTSSDVFALGVLLYRQLTGVMPRSLDGLSPWEAGQVASSTDAAAPSVSIAETPETPECRPPGSANSLRYELRGDLDSIVLKALRNDPEARYRSASQLGDDLDRHRHGLPVTARKGTLRYRLGKLLRRHRLVTVTTTLAVAIGIAFAGFSILSASRLARSEAQLIEERSHLQESQALLLGLVKQAGPYVAEGVPVTLREAVDNYVETLDNSANQLVASAALNSTLGWIYLDLGDLDQALKRHQRAMDIRTEAGDLELAENFDGMAAVFREQGQLVRADELSAKALDMHRQARSGAHLLLRSLNERVKLLCRRQDWQAADPLSAEAIGLSRAQINIDDTEFAKGLVQRAQVLKNLGEPERARRMYLESEQTFLELYGPIHAIFGPLYNNLAKIEAEAGRSRAATDYWRRSDEQYSAAFGPDYYERVTPLTHLGRVLYNLGDREAAETALHQALGVATRSPALGPQHEIYYYGRPAAALGALLLAEGRCVELVELLEAKAKLWAKRTESRNIVSEVQALLSQCGSQKL